jgi:hypothetical protein
MGAEMTRPLDGTASIPNVDAARRCMPASCTAATPPQYIECDLWLIRWSILND